MALDLQVRKSLPYKQPAFAAQWQGHTASVFAWDSTAVRTAQETAGAPRNAQVVPEAFMRARGTDGLRLVAMFEGFEGQLWAGGFLHASRWWPHVPDAAEWTKFVRTVGATQPAPEAQPEALDLELLERPWTEGTLALEDMSTLLQSPRVRAVAAAAALCPFAFIGAQTTLVSLAATDVRTEIEDLSSANQSIRRDRAEAYANLDAIEDVLTLDEYPAQADVLATAMTRLAETGAPRILSWSFDRGSLEIILRGQQDLDPTAYITLFERDPLFESVSGTFLGPERDLQLRMAVTKRALN